MEQAMARAEQCGGRALAEQARECLLQAGAKPRRATLTGVGSLTPAECRVVQLAAAGRTNRAIATMLGVTQRTVEIHLTHVYRKLGIVHRSQLGPLLTAHPNLGAVTSPRPTTTEEGR